MQRITSIVGRTLPHTLPTRRVSNVTQSPLMIAKRRVSFQCWDAFGFIKDGTDLKKRKSVGTWFYHSRNKFRFLIIMLQFGPATFVLWANGVFDYLFRRRTIAPLEPNWDGDYPFRPKDEKYENPLFEPARKHKIILDKRRAEYEKKWEGKEKGFWQRIIQ